MLSYLGSVKSPKLHTLLNVFIAIVWLVNGLVCKILNLVPRHELIVSKILGEEHALLFTKVIGGAEVLMMIWILSGIKSRFAAVFQIVIVMTMNVLELFLVPDLLLFGRLNIVVASLFAALIYINEFKLRTVKSDYASSE